MTLAEGPSVGAGHRGYPNSTSLGPEDSSRLFLFIKYLNGILTFFSVIGKGGGHIPLVWVLDHPYRLVCVLTFQCLVSTIREGRVRWKRVSCV